VKIGIVSGDYLRADRSPDNKERWGGAGWARLGQYVNIMRSAGHDVTVGHLWLRGNSFTVQDEYDNVHYPDVILMQRLMHRGLDQSVRIARRSGQIVVNDIDDWYWGLDPRNAAFKASHPKYNKEENTSFYRSVVSSSDHITVSTPYLAERVRAMTDTSVTIIKNYVDVDRFTKRTHVDVDRPEVGWAGSTDHRSGDIEILRGVIPPMYYSGTIGLVHGGHMASSPSFASKIGVPENAVRNIDRVDHAAYPSLLDFDIGIVPLRDIPFNHAKSDIKGLEYASAGIPFVASRLSAYVDLARDWDGSVFIAKHPKDWVKNIKALTNVDFRREVADANYERVRQRDIHVGAREVLNFISSLV
jgi:glycosyltransferase involved in cell wall biosynthesis